MSAPYKLDPLAYVTAVTRAARLLHSGTDPDAILAALERARAVAAHPTLIAALERRLRQTATIRSMAAQARAAPDSCRPPNSKRRVADHLGLGDNVLRS